MKILCYNNENALNVSGENFLPYDVVVFGFDGLKKISYKNELNGAEKFLPMFATLSKRTKKTVISGTITDNYGIIRKSAVIADNGRLIGISDMNLNVNASGFSQGGGYRVYQTSKYRIGVLVGDDIIDFDGVKSMTFCDADIIIALVGGEDKPQYDFLVRAYSYLFGVPMLIVTSGGVIASDIGGEICGGSHEDKCEIQIPTKKSYRIVQSKRRGIKE